MKCNKIMIMVSVFEIYWSVFCAQCALHTVPCLFLESTNTSTLVTIDFNDWKTDVQKVNEHENSIFHKTLTVALIKRKKSTSKIDHIIDITCL